MQQIYPKVKPAAEVAFGAWYFVGLLVKEDTDCEVCQVSLPKGTEIFVNENNFH